MTALVDFWESPYWSEWIGADGALCVLDSWQSDPTGYWDERGAACFIYFQICVARTCRSVFVRTDDGMGYVVSLIGQWEVSVIKSRRLANFIIEFFF